VTLQCASRKHCIATPICRLNDIVMLNNEITATFNLINNQAKT
jgi:hypothetical protein